MASSARPVTISSTRVTAADWGSYLVHGLASAERLFDAMAVVAAIYAADAGHAAIRQQSLFWQHSFGGLLGAAGFALLFVFLLERHGGYRPCLSLLGIRETERVLRVTLQAFLLALVGAFLFRSSVSRIGVAVALPLVPLFLVLEKWELHRLLHRLRSKGYGTRRALILGTGSTARRLYSALISSPKLGIEPVAFVEEGLSAPQSEIYACSYHRRRSAKVLPGPLSPELLQRLDVSVIVVADPAVDKEAILSQLHSIPVQTYFVAAEFYDPGQRMDYAELDGIMLSHASQDPPRALYELCKRTLDVAIAGVVLALCSPLACAVALLVKRTSPGPVLFRQKRVGKAGRLFTMYKFRTMYEDAPAYSYSPTQGKDSRITRLGRLLRRTSLDEIPQLLNVLLGQMSLVGPRPEMPFIVEQYTRMQRQRLALKPGLTGLWQISGDRTRLIHESPEYDAYYLVNNPQFVWRVTLQFAGVRRMSKQI